MKYPGARIALFAREPIVGKVKTRLIPALGANAALAVYEQLLQRQIHVLQAQSLCRSSLWVEGDLQATVFQQSGLALFRQEGSDLGQRLYHASVTILREEEAIILIGSDCPDLDESYLAQALQALYSGTEVVIGPAMDGGYVLLGLRQTGPTLFTEVDWGSAQVLQQTLERVRALGLDYRLLTALNDIDRAEDLQGYPDLVPR